MAYHDHDMKDLKEDYITIIDTMIIFHITRFTTTKN